VAPTISSYEKQQQAQEKKKQTKKMNEGVPFFASLMATTTDKMGKKSLESVGKLEALESFKREKNKRQNGERKWEGCG
jgi:hypothetical protein